MTDTDARTPIPAAAETPAPDRRKAKGPLVYRQTIPTRVTHWLWAICLFFLLLSGLQIFNAHPTLYIGEESGFEYDNAVFSIGARAQGGERIGVTTILGREFVTTGLLGVSGAEKDAEVRAFPSWSTIPSTTDLATGRVVHLFFAWVFGATMLAWLAFSIVNGHLGRDVLPLRRDWKRLPAEIVAHVKFRLEHRPRYNVLQKISYSLVLLVLFPLMILTGLAMSPGMNAAWPWLTDIFGGRQTARTIHFVGMVLIVLFFLVHIVMVIAAGPINAMRSMITGWYRTDRARDDIDPPAGR